MDRKKSTVKGVSVPMALAKVKWRWDLDELSGSEELQASCERGSIPLWLLENITPLTGARTKLQRQLAEKC